MCSRVLLKGGHAEAELGANPTLTVLDGARWLGTQLEIPEHQSEVERKKEGSNLKIHIYLSSRIVTL